MDINKTQTDTALEVIDGTSSVVDTDTGEDTDVTSVNEENTYIESTNDNTNDDVYNIDLINNDAIEDGTIEMIEDVSMDSGLSFDDDVQTVSTDLEIIIVNNDMDINSNNGNISNIVDSIDVNKDINDEGIDSSYEDKMKIKAILNRNDKISLFTSPYQLLSTTLILSTLLFFISLIVILKTDKKNVCIDIHENMQQNSGNDNDDDVDVNDNNNNIHDDNDNYSNNERNLNTNNISDKNKILENHANDIQIPIKIVKSIKKTKKISKKIIEEISEPRRMSTRSRK